MTDIPVFSIVIPIYNTKQYLARCVASVLHQTFSNIEILLVDDGSTDGSAALCDAYAQQDSRVSVIHKENGGLSDARNAGIDAAAGSYILFLDSDDYLEPDACERLLPAAETGSDILVGKWIRDSAAPASCPDGDRFVVWEARDYLKQALAGGHMSMAAVLYILNRSFVERHSLKFKYGICHEDDEFTPRAFLAAHTVTQSNVEFYHYILREGSITTQRDRRKNARDLFDTCMELESIYSKLADRHLARLLRDTLVMESLSLFQDGRLYRYGPEYLHRKFVFRNAFRLRTRLKAVLYCASPRFYWQINHWTKGRKR